MTSQKIKGTLKPLEYPAKLARWFGAEREHLPAEPFRLPDGRHVGNPAGWYDEIDKGLASWSKQGILWQGVILNWLENLQHLMNKRR